MNWNVRGINSKERWDDIRDRTEESQCDIICIEETKRDFFDTAYLRKFFHRKFNQFAYVPSIGNSGGIITIWNGNKFQGTIIDQNRFQLTIKIVCYLSGTIIFLTNIYIPC